MPEVKRRLASCPNCLAAAYSGEDCWNCGADVPSPKQMVPCPNCTYPMVSSSGFCNTCERLVDA